MIIRAEIDADHEAIMALTYAAFLNHPHHAPGAKPTEHLIYKGLKERGDLTLSFVATINDEVAGHIAFSPVTFDGKASDWLGLGPVSVSPEQQGKGVGSALIKAGLEAASKLGTNGVVLIGEPDYYTRFGFSADHGLTYPGAPGEYLLALSLTPDECEQPAGEVGYSPAFG